MPASDTTKALRTQLRSARRALTPESRTEKSLAITEALSRYLPFIRARRVAFYMATEEEVDTAYAIRHALRLGKDVYLPVINRASWRKSPLLFARFEPEQTKLIKNRFGIAEPAHRPGDPLRANELDLICVPLVGFNEHCDRIGMGGGYYDRALAMPSYRRTRAVGLAFTCQRADFEPASHDVPMTAIVTEAGIVRRS